MPSLGIVVPATDDLDNLEECWSPLPRRQPKTRTSEDLLPLKRLGSAAVSQSTVLLCAAYCAESVAAALIGTLLPCLARHIGRSTAQFAVLVPSFNAGCALGSAVGGLAFDSIGERTGSGSIAALGRWLTLVAALLFGIAAANLPMGVVNARGIVMVVCAVHGVFNGAFRTGANMVMLRLHPPGTVAPRLSAMHFCSGVGRFLAGLLGALFADSPDFHWAFRWAAAFTFAMSVCICATASSSNRGLEALSEGLAPLLPRQASTFERKGQCVQHFTYLVAVFAFLIIGVQNSFQYLVTSYALAASPPLTFTTSTRAAILSVHYGFAFAAGRLLSVFASARLSTLAMLRASTGITCAALAAVTALPSSPLALQCATVTLGLSLSSVLPSTLTYAQSALGCNISGGSLSMIMLAATGGGVLVPQLAGVYLADADPHGRGRGPEVMLQVLLLASVLGAFVLSWAHAVVLQVRRAD